MSMDMKNSETSYTVNISSIPLNGLSNSVLLKRKRPPMIEIPNVLTEIPVESVKDRLKSAGNCCKDDDGFISSSGFGVGVYSVKGKKKTMEDAHTIFSCPIAKKGFFGVYDGHGGSKAAQFVAEKLHGNIKEMFEKISENRDKEEAVKQGYLKTDEDFLKQGVSSGACCVTALIEGDELIVSNVGDCRAVLCRAGRAEAITKDHRASEVEERKRIEDKGGYVEMHRGSWRVHGVLSVTRSIGDAHLKNWVVAEPDTKIKHLTSDMEYLVLASDGLWDQVGNQEAIDILLRSCSEEWKLVANVDTANVNDDEYDCISTRASPKLNRLPVIKQRKRMRHSPIYRKRINCCIENDDFGCENESPVSKTRRISPVNHMKTKPHMPSQENIITQWKENANDFSCEIESPPSKAQRISLLNQVKMRPLMPSQENSINQWNENVNDFGFENESPSSKAQTPQRISLANQMKVKRQLPSQQNIISQWKENANESSPSKAEKLLQANHMNMKPRTSSQENSMYQWKENANDFANENEIPSSKAPKMRIKPQAPSHHNSIHKKRLTSGELVAAGKELVNLALSRGSLDDITVMIIDLHRLKD